MYKAKLTDYQLKAVEERLNTALDLQRRSHSAFRGIHVAEELVLDKFKAYDVSNLNATDYDEIIQEIERITASFIDRIKRRDRYGK